MQHSAMAVAANHAGADAANRDTQASLARGGIMKLAVWSLEAVVRSGAALHKQCHQPRRGHRQGHLALSARPGQQVLVGEGLAGPAWSINEEELELCEVSMPRSKAGDASLDPADDCLLVCVQQRSLTVHLALQLSTVEAELRHQHLVGVSPWKVFCTGLRQAQAPEALVVGAKALLDVSKGHVKSGAAGG